MPTTNTFIVLSSAGARRDRSRGAREQPFWDEHAAFIDRLVEQGFIVLGGPLVDEGGAMIVVRAESEDEVRATLRNDPWYQQNVLQLVFVKRWDIFIDQPR